MRFELFGCFNRGFKMNPLWFMFLLLCEINGNNHIYRASHCYGDSSAGTNSIQITCPTGSIYLKDIVAARKPKLLGCPDVDHEFSPANKTLCCTYADTDCFAPFTGDWNTFQTLCNHRASCTGIPVIRDENDCDRSLFDRFTNYMSIEYYCMPVGYTYGPCNTTADCNDPASVCNKSYCECQNGYTTFDAFDDCWKDGALNGSCTGPVGCQDANTMCNFTTGRCVCDAGFVAHNGICKEGGYNGGFCTDTTECTDDKAMCDTSVCVCEDGYRAYADFDDCWKDGKLNGLCNALVSCEDEKTKCDISTGRYVCETGFSEFENICYKDGRFHGCCNASVPCTDNHTHCDSTIHRCTCITEFSSFHDWCYEDEGLFGDCTDFNTCTDANTVCNVTSGRCVCNSGYIDYQDGHLHGYCEIDAECTALTECVENRCKCSAGYSDINNQCIQDGTVASKCVVDVDCDDGNAVCDDFHTPSICVCQDGYTDIDSTCKEDGTVIAMGNNSEVSNNVVHITNPVPGTISATTETCSVQVSCKTNVVVNGEYVKLNEENDACTQHLIIGGAVFNCGNSSDLPYIVSDGFFVVNLTNADDNGRFVMRIEAVDSRAEITVSCGNKLKTQRVNPTNQCDLNGQDDTEDEDKGTTCIMIVGVVIGVVVLLLLVGILAFLFFKYRKTIERKCCGSEDNSDGGRSSTSFDDF